MSRPIPPRRAAGFHRCAALTVAVLMAGSLFQAAPALAAPGTGTGATRPRTVEADHPVPGKALKAAPRKKDGLATGPRRAPHATWPKAGTAQVTLLAVPAPGAGSGTKARAMAVAPTPVPGLPVRLLAAPAEPTGSAANAPATDAVRAQVRVLPQDTARGLGLDGVLLSVSGTGPADTSGDGRRVGVSLDYSAFGEAYGGDYGARLRLATLPACALTTPELARCRTTTPVAGRNDGEKHTVSADSVALRPAASAVLLAAVADPAGGTAGAGDYTATPLSSSAAWQTSLQTGDFSWSYPLTAPTVPGGLLPKLSIGYSSGSIDGQTSNSNNQSSWLGSGFDMNTGFIERHFKPCGEDGDWSRDDAPGDQCWGYDNATISFNGRAGELIPAGKDVWRIRNDDGTRVEKLRNATERANGDNDGEYWKVTTTDGLQYFFGYNRLPSWSAGKPETKSTWNVPVFGNNADEPCHQATFAASWCRQAWRWNLDYVVDLNGNAMSYWYTPETNSYGRNRVAADDTSYERGGVLDHIEYGQRSDTFFTAKAAGKVVFTNTERCIQPTAAACAPAEIDKNATRWEDTPWDLNCKAGTDCDKGRFAPSFWSRKRLTKVTTQVLQPSGGYADADAWAFTQKWGDADIDRSLLLESIQHTGLAATPSITLPKVTFGYKQGPNRLDRLGDGIAPFIKYRLANVSDESGGSIDVAYSEPECDFAALPVPETNTTRCFPQYWQPAGAPDPVQEWFNKYVVTQVTATDRTGGSDDMVTKYAYLGGAAWHYADDDGLTKEKYKTWSRWNGYGRVQVRSGGWDGMRSLSEHWFLRGMDGDRKNAAGGTRPVTVSDGEGGSIQDHEAFQGTEFKTIDYTAPGGTVESRTVSTPWRKETAKRVRDWGTVTANLTGTAATRTWDRKHDGSWQETSTATKYDDLGRVVEDSDLGEAAAGDEECTITSYADNATTWLRALPKQVEVLDVACGTGVIYPAHLLSRKRNTYDNLAFGATPTRGLLTKQEELTGYTGTTPAYRSKNTAYDGYGRVKSTSDSTGSSSTTVFTPATATKPGSFTVTGTELVAGTASSAQSVVTEFDGVRSQPTATVDANGKRSEAQFDALGRLTKAWLANRPKASSPTPSLEYSYLIAEGSIAAVVAKKLKNDGSQTASYILYDGWLRPRQSQSVGPDGGRLVDDTFYDERGLVERTYAPYYATGAPGAELFGVTAQGAVDTQTVNEYDGLGRPTVTRTLQGNGVGTELSRTTTTHSADLVTVDPPTGTTPTETVLDAAGRVKELHEFHGSAPTGAFDRTLYEYDSAGRLTKVTAPDKTVRSYTYDLLGHQLTSTDPDSGTTRTTYDDADRVTTATDGRQKKLAFVYDRLGRHTETRENSTTGPLLASWTFDTVRKGYLSSSTRYVGGAAGAKYTQTIDAYDNLYRPLRTTVSVPASEPGLGGTSGVSYQTTTGYNLDGTVKSASYPAAGSLPAEVVAPTYDALQRVVKSEGLSTYIGGARYSLTGKLEELELGSAGKRIWINNTYEPGTQRLSTSRAEREGVAGVDRAATYAYDDSGNVTSVTDASRQGTDRQCFHYDYLQRLTEAWTPAGDCAPAPGATALGGPAPYWQSYTYTAAGNRDTDTAHDPALNASRDTKRTYRYDENGKGQPNTLTSVTSAGAVTGKDTYTYEPGGGTESRTPSGAAKQSFAWDSEGNLASVTEGSSVTSYLYDADGKRLISHGPGNTSTLYLGATEITWTKATGRTTARRYYDLGGASAVRQDNGSLSFVVADHHGTGELAVDASTQTMVQRRNMPFGEPRGTRPPTGSWPGTKGFVGGTQDSTGLTHLGAREYEPGTGRFISADPVVDPSDPQQLNGYAYAHSNPLRRSDPSGMYDPDERDYCNKNPGKCSGGKLIRSKPKPSKPKKNPNPGMDKKRAHMPAVQNERLERIIKELYIRPQVADSDVVGDGKTATALIEELNEGKAFGGDGTKWHIEKATAKLGGLRDLLEDDRKAKESTGKGILSDSDRKIALNESKELWTAINANDVAGQVTKNVKASPAFAKTLSKLVKTVISSESMSEVTGQKFAIPENLHPKAPQRAAPTGERVQGRGFAKAFGVVGGAASAAQYPMDVYNYGFEEATKKLTESLTDPLDMIPDGQGAGCALFGDCYVVVPVI
ncbi:RHS repeat-associated core domain-containing protein [Streptomyces sp. DT171]|uniref:RHS repeat domain-containing protein n=1 Tax=Streptomyces sp. DT171 TaxID=3416524 RepID=UPI003CE96F69